MFVIYNPTAGRRRAHRLWRVLDHLVVNGVRLEFAETQYPAHATELARQALLSGKKIVVAAGGDGTIAEVAAGLSGGDAQLGIIPLGTANVLAAELGLPRAARDIAASLAFGRARLLWPGIATSPQGRRLFVQMIGVGLDARVVHSLPLGLKRAFGRGAYVLQTMAEIARYDFPMVRLTIDGKAECAASVVICKGRLYGGNYPLALEADSARPGFQVALFERGGVLPALISGAALPLGLLPRMPGLRILSASEIDIAGAANDSTPLAAQADGDRAGFSPLSIRNADAPLHVII